MIINFLSEPAMGMEDSYCPAASGPVGSRRHHLRCMNCVRSGDGWHECGRGEERCGGRRPHVHGGAPLAGRRSHIHGRSVSSPACFYRSPVPGCRWSWWRTRLPSREPVAAAAPGPGTPSKLLFQEKYPPDVKTR